MRKLICIPLLNNWGVWLWKPCSQKRYSLDSMNAKAKIIIEGCPYCLHVSSELFFRIPYFTSYIDVNGLPLRQMCRNLCVLWVTYGSLQCRRFLWVRHVETSRREEEMGRVKGAGRGRKTPFRKHCENEKHPLIQTRVTALPEMSSRQ